MQYHNTCLLQAGQLSYFINLANNKITIKPRKKDIFIQIDEFSLNFLGQSLTF
jgi:hypothetical protein